ncbi:hypothetical protein EDD17DRAFT_1507816 [Pisolithus thermaeus]|nr:hypothetical protein EDD17DRAFT_1507816 [Pisolithus thermaeus]
MSLTEWRAEKRLVWMPDMFQPVVGVVLERCYSALVAVQLHFSEPLSPSKLPPSTPESPDTMAGSKIAREVPAYPCIITATRINSYQYWRHHPHHELFTHIWTTSFILGIPHIVEYSHSNGTSATQDIAKCVSMVSEGKAQLSQCNVSITGRGLKDTGVTYNTRQASCISWLQHSRGQPVALRLVIDFYVNRESSEVKYFELGGSMFGCGPRKIAKLEMMKSWYSSRSPWYDWSPQAAGCYSAGLVLHSTSKEPAALCSDDSSISKPHDWLHGM